MIVIPMAGLSSRFAKAGFTVPKYQLEAHGASLFAYSILSFSAYFASHEFLFVYREVDGTGAFIRRECARLGVRHARFVALSAPTAGQAETVILGLELGEVADETPLTIFNIDTFRPGLTLPEDGANGGAAGVLEVFEGEGEGWSFVLPDPRRPGFVLEAAEKRRISNLCCTGLYHFARAGDFRRAYKHPAAAVGEAETRERYVAPLYNALIRDGLEVAFAKIDSGDVIFCGVPDEYRDFLAAPDQAARLLAGWTPSLV